MKMKRKALEACQPPKSKKTGRRPKWMKPSVLQWLDELSKPPALCAASNNRALLNAQLAGTNT